ncbi:single-stranded DNA-binding protein [bacterium]|nr:single-stranded DNA-binding protein [bacterium]
MNVNKAILVGRVTRDPDVRNTASGQAVTNIGLATNNYWTDKAGQKQEKTEFHNIVLWGRLAEIAGQYLIKGQEAYIEGRIETRTYTGKDGAERRVTEIVAENMQLGSRPRGADYNASGASQPNQSGQPSQSQTQNRSQAQSQSQDKKQAPDENIPTINLDDDEQDEVKIEDVPF